jgi:DNA-binding CsgD family transcriptional regulator
MVAMRRWRRKSAGIYGSLLADGLAQPGGAALPVDPAGLVEATERLYRSLFAAVLGLGLGTVLWGMILVPLNGDGDNHIPGLAMGALLLAAAAAALARRRWLFELLRRRPIWLLAAAALSLSVVWADGGWSSSYYLASYEPVALAAVVSGLRWSLCCAVILTVGYLTGLALNGFTWAELSAAADVGSLVANTAGYLAAACVFAIPIAWLGGYVARINQIVSGGSGSPSSLRLAGSANPASGDGLTDHLSVREVEVVQLVAGGATNDEIAEQLVLSARTIQSHVENAMRKTGTRNRTELAVLAVHDGLAPRRCEASERVPLLADA